MATFTKFHCFVEDLAEKVHNLGSDTLEVAFCAAAHAPTASNSTLSALTVASTTYADSVTLTVSSSAQTSGTYKLILSNKTITATGGPIGPFRYVVIYNDTSTSDSLIAYYDYGSDITLADTESITLDFDATNGLFTLT